MKPLEVTISIRNNRLKRRRLDLGLNQAQLCRAVGISSQTDYSELESLRRSPFNSRGVLRPIARKLCDYHGVGADDLWPDEVLRVRRTKMSVEIDAAQVPRLMLDPDPARMLTDDATPEALTMDHEAQERLRAAIADLPERMRRAVELRHGFVDGRAWEYHEIAEDMGRSLERARQLVVQGLRRIEHRLRCETRGEMFDESDVLRHEETERARKAWRAREVEKEAERARVRAEVERRVGHGSR